MARITILVACGLNNAIGKDNDLLWKLPEDMKLFKANTLGRTVVMGRNTAVSLRRALPSRRNLVVTSRDAPYEGMEVVRSLQQAIDLVGENELCVIGGERLYREALPLADRLKITVVNDAPEADAFFPSFSLQRDWWLLDQASFTETETAPAYVYGEYCRYERTTPVVEKDPQQPST